MGGVPFCKLVIVAEFLLFGEDDCCLSLSLFVVDPFDFDAVEAVEASSDADNNDICIVDLDNPIRRTPREAATNNF